MRHKGFFFFIFSIIPVYAVDLAEQPKDYYLEMAVLNLFTYETVYRLELDPIKKLGNAQEMAFISFNYFVQKEKGLIKLSVKYEKAIKVVYGNLKEVLVDDPFLNPCVWKEGSEKPIYQFPPSHRLTNDEYKDMTKKFLEFLKS